MNWVRTKWMLSAALAVVALTMRDDASPWLAAADNGFEKEFETVLGKILETAFEETGGGDDGYGKPPGSDYGSDKGDGGEYAPAPPTTTPCRYKLAPTKTPCKTKIKLKPLPTPPATTPCKFKLPKKPKTLGDSEVAAHAPLIKVHGEYDQPAAKPVTTESDSEYGPPPPPPIPEPPATKNQTPKPTTKKPKPNPTTKRPTPKPQMTLAVEDYGPTEYEEPETTKPAPPPPPPTEAYETKEEVPSEYGGGDDGSYGTTDAPPKEEPSEYGNNSGGDDDSYGTTAPPPPPPPATTTPCPKSQKNKTATPAPPPEDYGEDNEYGEPTKKPQPTTLKVPPPTQGGGGKPPAGNDKKDTTDPDEVFDNPLRNECAGKIDVVKSEKDGGNACAKLFPFKMDDKTLYGCVKCDEGFAFDEKKAPYATCNGKPVCSRFFSFSGVTPADLLCVMTKGDINECGLTRAA